MQLIYLKVNKIHIKVNIYLFITFILAIFAIENIDNLKCLKQ